MYCQPSKCPTNIWGVGKSVIKVSFDFVHNQLKRMSFKVYANSFFLIVFAHHVPEGDVVPLKYQK